MICAFSSKTDKEVDESRELTAELCRLIKRFFSSKIDNDSNERCSVWLVSSSCTGPDNKDRADDSGDKTLCCLVIVVARLFCSAFCSKMDKDDDVGTAAKEGWCLALVVAVLRTNVAKGTAPLLVGTLLETWGGFDGSKGFASRVAFEDDPVVTIEDGVDSTACLVSEPSSSSVSSNDFFLTMTAEFRERDCFAMTSSGSPVLFEQEPKVGFTSFTSSAMFAVVVS